MLQRRRDVHRVVEPTPELVPPDCVMFRDPAADHQSARALRREHDVGEIALVPELVDPEVLVVLPERPELVPDGSVRDGGDDDGDAVLPTPVEDRLLVVRPAAELPQEFLRGPRLLFLEHRAQPGSELLLEDDPVGLVRDEDVAEAVHPQAVELHVVHLELAVVIVLPGARKVVVGGPARRDDDVDEFSLDEGPQNAPHPGRDEGGREGEERDAPQVAEHRAQDVGANAELLGGESSARLHLGDEVGDPPPAPELDVPHGAAEQVRFPHGAAGGGPPLK